MAKYLKLFSMDSSLQLEKAYPVANKVFDNIGELAVEFGSYPNEKYYEISEVSNQSIENEIMIYEAVSENRKHAEMKKEARMIEEYFEMKKKIEKFGNPHPGYDWFDINDVD